MASFMMDAHKVSRSKAVLKATVKKMMDSVKVKCVSIKIMENDTTFDMCTQNSL